MSPRTLHVIDAARSPEAASTRADLGRRALLVGGLAAVSAVGAGCRKRPALGATKTLRVGYIPISDYAPLFLGIEQGLFASEGLEVELTAMAGGASIIPALAGGSLDIGVSNHLSNVLAAARGIHVKLVSDAIYEEKGRSSEAIVCGAQASIAEPVQLNQKRVAVNTRNNIAHVGLMEWLERRGGDPKSIQFVELPFPQMPSALAQGHVHAAVLAEPYLTLALDQGGSALASFFAELRDPAAISGFVATRDWLTRNDTRAAAFHRAHKRAIALATSDERLARRAIAKYTKIDASIADRIRIPAMHAVPNREAIAFWIYLAKKWKLVDATFDMSVSELIWEGAV